ncbi:ran-binding protein 9-like isoform X1 [Stegodyphus dumicola]|uniref:ran-binding protein 9-like isoform X1 n=1 Tax=Stegodyphus dumicola TaxID=202533 RepID=UPI0015B09139|nr:ran-binding protein 9-like isoform X1 [Stegodyphus dumicola]
MATMTEHIGWNESQITSLNQQVDRLKLLYPMVNESETPLPRSWSPKDKFTYIGLSQNNLRVHYKGSGKNHKDAASVRATHPIPAACGLYYFEVKIVSKGRDGYMGVGLSAQGVNMNRLPGWDKQSYGYHGDDGHSFCSSGTGQPYGPTFTTGDVIGCGVNLIDNTCFYTKNGHHLGIAFTDLPPNLYPTVGLQTPGEVVDANFGQSPFVFDIEDMMKELKRRTRLTIERFPVVDKQGEWQTTLHRIVQTYLVHHGYCAAAEAFAQSTGQAFTEDIKSIKNRQQIQKLVLAGRMGEAIQTTQNLYPGLLEQNPNLLFMLKCRQFVEMVNGTDSEVRPTKSPRSHSGSPCMSPNYPSVYFHRPATTLSTCSSPVVSGSSPNRSHSPHSASSQFITPKPSIPVTVENNNVNNNVAVTLSSIEEMNTANRVMNGEMLNGNSEISGPTNYIHPDADVEMENLDTVNDNAEVIRTLPYTTNGTVITSNLYRNGEEENDHEKIGGDMDVDAPLNRKQVCGGSQAAIERMLNFGRELHSMSVQLKRDYGTNTANKKMLQEGEKTGGGLICLTKGDAFSLLAYADPWASPVGYQLDPVQREPVCAALNSAILESQNLPRQPPLEVAMAHTQELVKLMSKAGLGSCAFTNLDNLL